MRLTASKSANQCSQSHWGARAYTQTRTVNRTETTKRHPELQTLHLLTTEKTKEKSLTEKNQGPLLPGGLGPLEACRGQGPGCTPGPWPQRRPSRPTASWKRHTMPDLSTEAPQGPVFLAEDTTTGLTLGAGSPAPAQGGLRPARSRQAPFCSPNPNQLPDRLKLLRDPMRTQPSFQSRACLDSWPKTHVRTVAFDKAKALRVTAKGRAPLS